MFQIARRLILVACLLASLTLSYWTNGAVVSVHLADTLTPDALPVDGPAWNGIYEQVSSVAQRNAPDPGTRARLAKRQESLVDSTLTFEPGWYEFYYRADEAPWNSLAGRLRPNERTGLSLAGQPAPRGLTVTLHPSPRASDAPDALVYPWYNDTLAGWLVILGVAFYAVTAMFAGAAKSLALDPRLTFLQTLLGVVLAAGFWWIALVRADPVTTMLTQPTPGTSMALAGLLGALLLLVAGGWRAARRLALRDDRAILTQPLGQTEILPANVASIVRDEARKLFELTLAGSGRLKIPFHGRLARQAIALLGRDCPPAAPASATAPDMPQLGDQLPMTAWFVRRLLPALLIAFGLGLVVGFFRASSTFFVGIQGMIIGMGLGGIAGYFARWDHPQDWNRARQWSAAALVVSVFMLAQLTGIGTAMRDGSGLHWLTAMLTGRAHEAMLGYRRYRLHALAFQPGPTAWVLLNLLDLVFLFLMTLLLLGVNLARRPPETISETRS